MDDADRIATCKICTIADNLKVCKACSFNIGLRFRVMQYTEPPLSADCQLRIEELRVILLDAIAITPLKGV